MRRLRTNVVQVLGVFGIMMFSVVVCASGNDAGGAVGDTGMVAQATGETPAVQPVVQPAAEPTVQQPVVEPTVQQPVVEPTVQQPVVEPTVQQPVVAEPAGPACANVSGVTFPPTLQNPDRPRKIIITSVDFTNEIVVIKNVTADETLNLTDRWRVFTRGSDRHLNGVSLAPGASVRLHLVDEGINDADDVYLGIITLRLEPCSGEVAIIHNTGNELTGWFNDPGFMESFVAWGSAIPGTASATFNDEAVGAGAWVGDYTQLSSYVQTGWFNFEHVRCYVLRPNASADDLGIVATGDVTLPTGWTRVEPGQEACFGY